MRASVFALVVAAALLAGCGGSSKSNGEASKSPSQVLADAKAAAASTSSGHVSLDVNSDGTAVTGNLSMVRHKGATGSASLNGAKFDLVRVGDTVYIHGTDAFYLQFAGKAIAQLLHGKWVKIPSTEPRFESFAALTDLSGLVAKIGSTPDKLVNDGKTTYKGEQVVAIRDTADNSKLYVAATGKPYPVALVGGKASQSGTVTFGDWNKPVSLTAPRGAVDISTFGG